MKLTITAENQQNKQLIQYFKESYIREYGECDIDEFAGSKNFIIITDKEKQIFGGACIHPVPFNPDSYQHLVDSTKLTYAISHCFISVDENSDLLNSTDAYEKSCQAFYSKLHAAAIGYCQLHDIGQLLVIAQGSELSDLVLIGGWPVELLYETQHPAEYDYSVGYFPIHSIEHISCSR